MSKPKGFFVTFEGTEGAGKSTLMRLVAERLTAEALSVTTTREPGGNAVAERIRKVILEQKMDPWSELFLYEAARAEHLAQVVRPALARGDIVLCDRFTDSSLAYQSHARGLPWKTVSDLNRIATQGLKPSLTVLVDIDPAEGLRRATEQTRFEAEGVAFQQKVRRGFLKSRAEDPRRWIRVDAGRNPAPLLAEKVHAEITRRLSKKGGRSR